MNTTLKQLLKKNNKYIIVLRNTSVKKIGMTEYKNLKWKSKGIVNAPTTHANNMYLTHKIIVIANMKKWHYVKSKHQDNVGIEALKNPTNIYDHCMHDSAEKVDILSKQFKSVFYYRGRKHYPR